MFFIMTILCFALNRDRDIYVTNKSFPTEEPRYLTVSYIGGKIEIKAKAVVDIPTLEVSEQYIKYPSTLVGHVSILINKYVLFR